MRAMLLLLLFLTGCASVQKTEVYKRCAQPSYDNSGGDCSSSPYNGCDPSAVVFACDVVGFHL